MSKVVKIVRAAKGNETVAAQEIADFYNEMAEKDARTSRATMVAAGEDVVYTIYADVPDEVEDEDADDDDEEDEEEEDEEEDEELESPADPWN